MKSRFDLDFISRTLKTTGVVLLVGLIFGLYYFGLWPALGYFSGGVWGMINLLLLMRLVRVSIRPDGADLTAALILALVKFPLLYLSGYFLLKVEQFDAMHLLYGFTTVLLVIVLKAFGRLMLGLDDDDNSENVQKVI